MTQMPSATAVTILRPSLPARLVRHPGSWLQAAAYSRNQSLWGIVCVLSEERLSVGQSAVIYSTSIGKRVQHF